MRDWSTSNRTIQAQREAGRADVPDMPEAKPAAACPQCGGWSQAGGMSQHALGERGCRCHRKACSCCGGRQAFIKPAPSTVLRCLDCGFEEGWPVCQVCEAGDVVDGECVQCGTREV